MTINFTLAMMLTFFGHVYNQPNVRIGWADCHETKKQTNKKKIDRAQVIRCEPDITDSYCCDISFLHANDLSSSFNMKAPLLFEYSDGYS